MTHENKKLSALKHRFIPKYIRESYGGFATLVEKYFEYLEREKGEYDLIAHLLLYGDVDNTIDEFFDDYRKQNLQNIPEYTFSDQINSGETTERQALAFLVKNIRQFYQSKGSEASYDFIFKAVWDTFIEFYYPRNNMLRVSDGKWENPRYLELKDAPGAGNILNGDLAPFVSYKLRGQTSGATAYAESIVTLPKVDIGRATYPFYEFGDLTLNQQGSVLKLLDLVGEFEIDEQIDMVELPTGVVSQSAFVSQLIAEVGQWTNTDGFISWDMFLQDNDYYQDLSYEIRGDLSKDVYEKVLRETVHPAGTKLFSLVAFEIINIIVALVGTTSFIIMHYFIEVFGWSVVATTAFKSIKNHDYLIGAATPQRLSYDLIEENKEDLTAIPERAFLTADDFNDVIIGDFEYRKGTNTTLVFEDGLKVPYDSYDTKDGFKLNFINSYIPNGRVYARGFDELDNRPYIFNTGIGTDNYTLPFSVASKYDILVFDSAGNKLLYTDYEVSGTTLTLNTTPTMVSVVEVMDLGTRNTHAQIPDIGTTIADQTWYTVANVFDKANRDVLVFLDGVLQRYSIEYGIKGNQLAFKTVPTEGSIFEVVYLKPSARGYVGFDGNGATTVFSVPFTSLPFDFTYTFDVNIV